MASSQEGNADTSSLKAQIAKQLHLTLEAEGVEILTEYIMRMISVGSVEKDFLCSELDEFLLEETGVFVAWLLDVLSKQKASADLDISKDSVDTQMAPAEEDAGTLAKQASIRVDRRNKEDKRGRILSLAVNSALAAPESPGKRACYSFYDKDAHRGTKRNRGEEIREVPRNKGSGDECNRTVYEDADHKSRVILRPNPAFVRNHTGEPYLGRGPHNPYPRGMNHHMFGRHEHESMTSRPGHHYAPPQGHPFRVPAPSMHCRGGHPVHGSLPAHGMHHGFHGVIYPPPVSSDNGAPIVDNQCQMKIKKRCGNFPNCRFGDQCRYIHPSEMCDQWPNCPFATECFYIHPELPCKFGISCYNAACNYCHPEGWNPVHGGPNTVARGGFFKNRTLHLTAPEEKTTGDANSKFDEEVANISSTLPMTPPGMKRSDAPKEGCVFEPI